MKSMDMHVLIRISLAAVLFQAGSVGAQNICQGNPADVFFLLDSSGSIWGPDFVRQLEFVKGVVDIFDVSPDMTRVGALSFSNWAFVDFHLDTYHTKREVQAAIGQIRQIRGDTNTAAALAYMRDVAVTEAHGARRGIPQIAVVLTDGKSNKPWSTAREALKSRLSGIHVFAIGIGNQVDGRELSAIASTPSAKYVFRVGSYSALRSIRKLLAIETCKVTDPPTTPPLTTTQPPLPKQGCGDATFADIVFGVSPNGSPENTVKALEFYSDVAATFDITNDLVRIGLVPKECTAVPELNVQGFTDKDDLNRQLDVMQIVRKTPASVLRYMRQVSFNQVTDGAARPRAKRIAVIIVDEADVTNTDDVTRAIREATMTKYLKNVELYVIGVGGSIDMEDLKDIATVPSDTHVLHVDDYDKLFLEVERLRNLLCPDGRQKTSRQ